MLPSAAVPVVPAALVLPRNELRAWTFGADTLLEWYAYAPGPAQPLPKHAHEEYQFCVGMESGGAYWYRGARHVIPPGSLTVLHPGEAHAPLGTGHLPAPITFRVLYAAPALLESVARDVHASGGANGSRAPAAAGAPFFGAPIVLDSDLVAGYWRLHETLEAGSGASQLEQDARLLGWLADLVRRHAPPPLGDSALLSFPAGGERAAVRRARALLADQLDQNVSLDDLAHVAGLSAFHLCRVFRAETGLPPHAYQTSLRVARAKTLLARGRPIGEVAGETGFAHQSHFGRHFKRLVGVTPGAYAASKPRRGVINHRS